MPLIGWHRRADGIVVLTIDDPDRSTNTLTERYLHEMGEAIDQLEAAKPGLTGVIVTSGKDSFLVGLDLKEFTTKGSDLARGAEILKSQFRRLETLGVPVVAALTGTAL